MKLTSVTAFDMDSLQQVETACFRRLEEDPADTGVRLRLAWCLAFQALHRSGQESYALHSLEGGKGPQAPLEREGGVPQRDSLALLQKCLRQINIVMQLSIDPRERSDAERLRGLIRMSGGEEAVWEAEQEATRASQRLVQDICRVPVGATQR